MSAVAADGARARPVTSERRLADAVRALTIDAVEAAKSGYPRIPLGMADAASVLWRRFLKFDAADPSWPDRDRFVLSVSQGALLLYALLCLTGHVGTDIAVLRRFRQLHAAALHPALLHPAIEAGPLGQGLANAVGMALAERLLAARFGRSLVDHRTWVIASAPALMRGVSHETTAIAGRLKLARLTVLYDESTVPFSAGAEPGMAGDPLKRFAALGWATKRVESGSPAEVAGALSFAMRSPRPTLIACRPTLGFGAPNRTGAAAGPEAAFGRDEALATKRALGWTAPPFTIPEDIATLWREAGVRGARARRAWLRRLAHHARRAEFERITEGRLPQSLPAALARLKVEFASARPRFATEQASRKILEALSPLTTELIGGSIDLAGAREGAPGARARGSGRGFARHAIHYGVHEHGMAAAMNGLARHGGIIPYGRAILAFSDTMRPELRLAALMRARVIHIFAHDSIEPGEDGPEPIGHLASLRAIPNFFLFRPADAVETAECWGLALARRGPSALVVTRQAVPTLRTSASENLSARGGYILAAARDARRATLIASGPEVAVAIAAQEALAAEGIGVAVVSLPCWKLFERQDPGYRGAVLGTELRVGIEAASGFGWERWIGSDGIFVGRPGFGEPAEAPFQHFDITPEAVAGVVKERIG